MYTLESENKSPKINPLNKSCKMYLLYSSVNFQKMFKLEHITQYFHVSQEL